MKRFFKYFGLILGIMLLLDAFFYKFIPVTIIWYTDDFAEEYPVVLKTPKDKWLTYNGDRNETLKYKTINNLNVPILFQEEFEIREETGDLSLANVNKDGNRGYLADTFPSFQESATALGMTSDEFKKICEENYSKEKNVCTPNHLFFIYMVNSSPSDISFFSSAGEKTRAFIFMRTKAIFFHDVTSIQNLAVNNYIRGYWVSRNDKKNDVYLFDNDDNIYQITFFDMNEDEISKILINTEILLSGGPDSGE